MTKKQIVIVTVALAVLLISIIVLTKNKSITYETYEKNSPPRIGAVHLTVSDLERSVKFYEQMIGFDILTKQSNKVTLTADGTTPLLILEEEANSIERPLGTTGLYHFAILLPDRSSLANALLHLADNEYPMQGAANHQYSDALYLADPEGNGIEIYADYPSNEWKRATDGSYVSGTYPIDLNDLAQEATPPWSGLPDNTRVGHMHLQVAELEKVEQFYVDGLGFNITSKDNGSLFLSKDNYHHHIALNTWSGTGLPTPPDNARGLKKFIVFFTQDEIDEAKVQLKRLNIPFDVSNDTMSVVDPSGNKIEIIIR
ncbi:VOC family protein [Viridibacillus sp. YIM B01967]|uniref:VOC family protein n=1 Tax=Viridibacillus soli TaxID=2798301 RepID=A0ABS1H8Z2_9BACL|nr:VOC family protein [Viridibacillus soli]MBK3495892.1 VOC family protein [Viridibacillus soli]